MPKPKYARQHQLIRKAAMARLTDGQPCLQDFADGTVCGQPMYHGQALDLGHTTDGTRYLGLVHAHCNRKAAAQKRNSTRTRTCRRCRKSFLPAAPMQRICSDCLPIPSSSGRRW